MLVQLFIFLAVFYTFYALWDPNRSLILSWLISSSSLHQPSPLLSDSNKADSSIYRYSNSLWHKTNNTITTFSKWKNTTVIAAKERRQEQKVSTAQTLLRQRCDYLIYSDLKINGKTLRRDFSRILACYWSSPISNSIRLCDKIVPNRGFLPAFNISSNIITVWVPPSVIPQIPHLIQLWNSAVLHLQGHNHRNTV